MENELQVFSNSEFGEIRAVEVDGKPYAVGVDVARALNYAKPSQAVIDHCKGIRKLGIPSAGGSQETNVITEGDIYRLIIKAADQSRNPDIKTKAARFESWVFDEVIPSIRKHGAYATDATIEKILNDPDFGIQLLITLKDEREKRVKAEKTNAILMHVNKTYTATEIAKELGFSSAIALNKFLHDQHIQFKQNKTWVLYSDYANQGYTEIKQEVLDNGKIIYHRRWTQLGRDFLLQKFSPACAV